MAILRVYFFGLIGHISESEQKEKDYAALVRNEHHVPLIIMNSGARLIKPDVQKITFGDAKPADIDQLFDSYVPPLKKILRGKLATNIKSKMIEVRYPGAGNFGSMLSVVQLYRYRGLYHNGIDSHLTCVARVTVATLTTTAQRIVCRATDQNGTELWTDTLPLDTDRCVVVANVAEDIASEARKLVAPFLNLELPDEDHGSQETALCDVDDEHDHGSASSGVEPSLTHAGPHVQIFGELLDDDVAASVTLQEYGQCSESVSFVGCDWVKELLKPYEWASGDTVECGNTQWP